MISLILTIAVLGFVVWLIMQIPMAPVFRNIIMAISIFLLILILLQMVGIEPLNLRVLRGLK